MAQPITDTETFKAYLRERARQTWDDRQIPYYLSIVATDLKRMDIDYHKFTGSLRLVQWASKEQIPETKLVTHPTIKAKVGLLPADVEYDFTSEPTAERPALKPRTGGKRGQALIKFVDALAALPETAAAEFTVPAKVLIALLQN
jgi:hypothetical protein